MVYNLEWSQTASCVDLDPNIFFDYYEEYKGWRFIADAVCNSCPIQQTCLAMGAAKKETGEWGGVYLTEGKIDEDLNDHKTENDWRELWLRLTTLMK